MAERKITQEGFRCPFCAAFLQAPETIDMKFGETYGGHCECGAAFVYDRSGRMMGEAFNDALVLAYDGDYDAAFSAEAGDYDEITLTYSPRHRKFVLFEGRYSKSGKFIFVKRLKKA